MLRYFLNDFDGTSYPYDYWYHFFLYYTCILFLLQGLFYFRIFSASLLITFLPPDIATSISLHIPFSCSRNHPVEC